MNIPESHLAQEAIAALVDGELPAGPAGRAARHLAGCTQCRMAVQAQREAKDALHAAADVALPGDLLSRLCAIPFTADVPAGGSLGGLSAGPGGGLVMDGPSGGWSVDLTPSGPAVHPHHARWLRRGVAGTLAGLGLGVALLAVTLPGDDSVRTGRTPVAGPSAPEERTEIVPPVTRAIAVGDRSTLAARSTGGTP